MRKSTRPVPWRLVALSFHSGQAATRPTPPPTRLQACKPARGGKRGGLAVYLEVSQCGPSCRSCSLIGHAGALWRKSRVINVAKPCQRPSHDQEVPNKGRLAPGQPLRQRRPGEEVQGKAHPLLARLLLFSWPPTTDIWEMLACLPRHDGKARRRKNGAEEMVSAARARPLAYSDDSAASRGFLWASWLVRLSLRVSEGARLESVSDAQKFSLGLALVYQKCCKGVV